MLCRYFATQEGRKAQEAEGRELGRRCSEEESRRDWRSCEPFLQFRLHFASYNMSEPRHIAVICASNQNRSMETHNLFVEKGIPNVSSYGTGSQIKLPGPSRTQPNVYDFGISYREIYEDLMSKDAQLCVSKFRLPQNSILVISS